MSLKEASIESHAIQLLGKQGYTLLTPEEQLAERGEDYTSAVLQGRLRSAIAKINPQIPQGVQEQALQQLLHLPYSDLLERNEHFHQLLTEGIPVEYLKDGEHIG